MQANAIFGPFLGMMLLTFTVWIYMYYTRIRFLRQHKINPQKLATRSEVSNVIPPQINQPADNFANLCELPVLFYAVCLYLYATQQVDLINLTLAYLFLFFRVLHSVIQCTFNKVMWRFSCYFLAALLLWGMVLRAAARALF